MSFNRFKVESTFWASPTELSDLSMRVESTLPFMIHVLKVPSTVKGGDWRHDHLFPYTHYRDEGHAPFLVARRDGDVLRLSCDDLFKMKVNRQEMPRNRIDLYMPGSAAIDLAVEIVRGFGPGDLPQLAAVDPEAARQGEMTLPIIRETRRVTHQGAGISIAGWRVSSRVGPVYIDDEEPREGHVEMLGPEVHIGIPLSVVEGARDPALVTEVVIPNRELRAQHGEANPFPKARGAVAFAFDATNARSLAATLLRYGQGHRR